MKTPILFPYKRYRNYPCPIIRIELSRGREWFETEAYVDSGASFSIFSLLDAERLGLSLTEGRRIYTVVGDGRSIPVYLHRLSARIGSFSLKATIGFSPKLGVGFNLLGRKDFFTAFDITFSDSTRTISFIPR